MNITIIDYGMGNVHSVCNALTYLGFDSVVTSDADKIEASDILIFPGVGAFGQGMEELKKRNLIESIKEYIASGKPFLGICLGMQLLFEESTEHGNFKGLGILKGKVVEFDKKQGLKVPHMGWNSLKTKQDNSIFEGIEDNSYFYFVHSYYVLPKQKNIIAGITEYGTDFCSMIIKDNIYAMQFHPEKSQKIGLKLLNNFLSKSNI
jgi:imidazole glycerol-phosphate synthase subunit HisH